MNSPTPSGPHNLEHAAVHPNGNGNGNGDLDDLGELVETRHGIHQVSPAVADRLKGLNAPAEEAPPGGSPHPARSWTSWIVLGTVGLATLAALGYWAFSSVRLFGSDYTAVNSAGEEISIDSKGLQFSPAGRGDILFTIIEKGELEAVVNTKITCKVRSSGRGSSDATTIKRLLVKDGDKVDQGQLLVELDKDSFEEQLKTQNIQVNSAELAKKQAVDDLRIVESQNEIDIKVADAAVQIALLNQKKYLEGDLEQKRKDVLGRKTLAESDYVRYQEKYAISQRALQRGILSPSQAQQDEAALRKAEIDLKKVEEELRVLDLYESKVNIKDWEIKVEEAKKKLETVKIQAASKENQAQSNRKSKEAIWDTEQNKARDLEEDIANCAIKAPRSGMVVFYVDERSSYGFGSSQRMVADGEKVGNGQHLMQIPDLSQMQVKVKVHESLEPRLRAALQGGASAATLLATIKVASREQPLLLQGHLRSVDATASAIDRYSSDVRVHVATVAIDRIFDPTGFYIKPGTSAEVTIFVDERKNVLKLPVQAVLAVGNDRFCYVLNGDHIEKRALKTDLNNTKYLEILGGLQEGEEVLQNPRTVAEKLGHLDTTASKETTPEQPKPSQPTPRPPDPGPGTNGEGTKPPRTGGGFDPNTIFDRLDKNMDGKISKSEATGKLLTPQNFDQHDTNKDGFVDKAEFLKALERLRPPGGGAPGGNPPPDA